MKSTTLRLTAAVCLLLAQVAFASAEVAPGGKSIISFGGGFDLSTLRLSDADVGVVNTESGQVLQVSTGHREKWPGLTIAAPDGGWDLSSYGRLTMWVCNTGSSSVTVNCRVDSPGRENRTTINLTLKPGESDSLNVPLKPLLPAALKKQLFGMRGNPGGAGKEEGFSPKEVSQLIIFVNNPEQDHQFQLGDIRVEGDPIAAKWRDKDVDDFFPMIDEMGQFIHDDWPGKMKSVADLEKSVQVEDQELAAHPGPADWNRYGGWTAGPQLQATGFFHPKKVGRMWWLVDPEGRLFWSHGVDCVGHGQGTTPISDREFYFAGLPSEDSPLSVFYGRASWAPHGYYQDKGSYRTYCLLGANLMRKYGDDWYDRAAQRAHRRLRSWSMNTIANWSDSGIYLLRKTPYVVSISYRDVQKIEGSSGYWGKFPDPFHPSFERSLRSRMADEVGKSAGDPWCIGYFVDNELAWGEALSLAQAALMSPPDQAAKQQFLKDLESKYTTIEKLNDAWGTSHSSWDALRQSQTAPDEKRAGDDLAAFYRRIAEQYFQVCRQMVKQVAPNQLYLGCRFAWTNDLAARAAADFCDVIGYNLYRDDVSEFELPEGVDMPVIIGEFHFGALDRGMFHTGLRPVENQQARAAAYKSYVTGALRNPCFVGSHWFQYSDQATTGRGDGENYQIGLVNICDRPYPETINAVREIGNAMYRLRYDLSLDGQ
jgi:hypothetical protein